jgi:hypothetical protein
VLLAGAGLAAEKKIVLEGKFGKVESEQSVKPGYGPELGQKVRVDQLTSGDPDWNGSTMTLYEHSVSHPTNGTYAIYGVLAAPSGDTAYLEFAGKWDVVTKDGKFAEAPFAAEGKIVGGTGKLEKISGTVRHSGKVVAGEGGRYSIEMSANY